MKPTGSVAAGVHQALLAPPDAAPLLLGGGQALSYGQCRDWVARASQGPMADCAGQAVAIWMDKGPLYAQCVLAALFAGARYLPLDGAQPAERVRAIVADAGPRLLVLDAAHARLWLAQPQPADGPRLLVLSDEAAAPGFDAAQWQPSALDRLRAAAPLSEQPVALDEIAAILYTSGSTGQPKGVQLSQRNLLNFAAWSARTLALDASDRLLNLASFNFDLSTFDLFAGLQAGASLYVTSEPELHHPAGLGALIEQQRISVMYAVPSLYGLLIRSGVLEAMRPRCALRRVVFAGEVMPKPLLQRLAAALPQGCGLYNFYGPTETNVCLWHAVEPAELDSPEPVPIGLPIAGAEVWLQDEQGRRVEAEGELGEIWVAGDCVTPGYWRRPDDANSANHRRGCHATGDQGSWRAGRLQYHGRQDRMLKVNGYRVELGEIEAALARHPQLAEVAVLGMPANGGVRLLAAYVPREGALVPGSLALKQHCATLLPAYMVPQQLVALAGLPKNANGKTDLRRLREQLIGNASD
ncbi:AMP-binding protein [Roseateles sp. DAIF2]|uniref:AMP-binding protein n=1 Tax=Roseateles sp. DAIF2 TaxID=2714952 RepID=UPI0018A33AF0|nr:AMP-binding protein [Roseateles sp. DAIF2]QPF73616.1 AMP-binding protein [Roseateles sp. DAIF2]